MAKPAPRQMKETYKPGTKVIFSFWWYGREHKHNGHLCKVVKQWVKVAGKVPRNYYKYRLKCIDPRCTGGEFNTEDCSASCQGVSPASKRQLAHVKDYVVLGLKGEIFWGDHQ